MRSIARPSNFLLLLALFFAAVSDASADPPVFFDGAFEPFEIPQWKQSAASGAIAVGDMNGDGRDDAVIVFNGVAVMLSRGAVGFDPAVVYGTGTSYEHLSLGDLNADGFPDVAATTANAAGVRVFLNDGHGVLGPPLSLNLGTGCVDVAIGDLDGNGSGDIVVARSVASALVLMGHGDGTFDAPTTVTQTSGSTRVTLGYLDDDTDLDAAFGRASGGGADIVLGRGDGTFDPSLWLGGNGGPRGVQFADLYGDPRPEIVLCVSGNQVQVNAFNLDHTFGPVLFLTSSETPWDIAAGDLDGDGFGDLVVAVGSNGVLNAWHGDGAGGFGPRVIMPGAFKARSVGIGDRDADGRLDLFAFGPPSGVYFTAGISVSPGRPDFFSRPGRVPSTYATGEVAVADLNLDGRQDLAGAEDDYYAVALGGPGDTFTTTSYYHSYNMGPIAAGLIDSDGIPDLFTGTYTYMGIRFGNGDGTFGTPTNLWSGSSVTRVAIVDIDHDGRQDVAALINKDFNWKLNALPTSFSTCCLSHISTNLSANPPDFAIAPVDLDAYPDLVVPDPVGDRLLIARGTGSGFDPPTFVGGLNGVSCVAVGLINDDLFPDIIAGAAGTQNGNVPQKLFVLIGDGLGGFTIGSSYPAGNEPVNAKLVDLDGDGALDAVLTNRRANSVSVFIGNGDGTFRDRRDYGAGVKPENCAVGNLIGNAGPDLVTGGLNTGFTILENIGTDRVSAPEPSPRSQLSFSIRPNPFMTSVFATVQLPSAGPVVLETYDIGGRRVAEERLNLAAGAHQIALRSLDGLRAGVYLVRLRQGSLVATARVCRMR